MSTIVTGFAALRHAGLVARRNFCCCSSCALAALSSEYDRDKKHRDKLGFAFFHRQDGDALKLTGYVDVRHGVFPRQRESETRRHGRAIEVARIVVATLNEAGLSTTWDGKQTSTIVAHGAELRARAIATLRLVG